MPFRDREWDVYLKESAIFPAWVDYLLGYETLDSQAHQNVQHAHGELNSALLSCFAPPNAFHAIGGMYNIGQAAMQDPLGNPGQNSVDLRYPRGLPGGHRLLPPQSVVPSQHPHQRPPNRQLIGELTKRAKQIRPNGQDHITHTSAASGHVTLPRLNLQQPVAMTDLSTLQSSTGPVPLIRPNDLLTNTKYSGFPVERRQRMNATLTEAYSRLVLDGDPQTRQQWVMEIKNISMAVHQVMSDAAMKSMQQGVVMRALQTQTQTQTPLRSIVVTPQRAQYGSVLATPQRAQHGYQPLKPSPLSIQSKSQQAVDVSIPPLHSSPAHQQVLRRSARKRKANDNEHLRPRRSQRLADPATGHQVQVANHKAYEPRHIPVPSLPQSPS